MGAQESVVLHNFRTGRNRGTQDACTRSEMLDSFSEMIRLVNIYLISDAADGFCAT